MKRSKSTSSHVLSKLGLLAAVGTASVGGVLQTVSWAQQQAEPTAVSENRGSRWGTQPIASETVLQGIRASAAESAAGNAVSPYRAATSVYAAEAKPAQPTASKPTATGVAANQAVDLSSAYRPAGANEGGSNQGATLGVPPVAPKPQALATPAPQPQVLTAVDATASEEDTSVDLTSKYQPQPTTEKAEPAEAEATVPSESVAEVTEETVATEQDHKPSEEPGLAEAPAKKRSLLQAMLAGEPQTHDDETELSIDRAQRVKHRFTMLGLVAESTCPDGTCNAETCNDTVSVAVAPVTEEPAAESTGGYPTTSQPTLVPTPAVYDEAISQASHVVPAQWREAQPRAIQVVQGPGNPFADDPTVPGQLPAGHFEVIQEEDKALEVRVRRSLLLRTPFDIYRTAVVDSAVCDVVQFTPREVSIVGKSTGSTNVTFWFEDGNHRPVTYVVRVIPDLEEKSQTEVQYRLLEDVLSELFPDSKIRLMLVADKLIVKGQAASAEEAANILAIIRGQSSGNIANNRNFVSPVQGFASPVFNEAESGRGNQPRIQVVNMLQVPGVQQVALRVKIAQLNRSAARGVGVDADARINFGGDDGDALFVQSMLNMAAGNSPSVISQFDDSNINIGLRYLQQQGVIRVLSEPTLVTLSGRPATFVSGGEFAVPTIVGGAGVNAVTTDFRSFGVIVSFLPTVLDKDRIRLQVAPEFSQINSNLTSANGTFGLDTNAVTTTVEMREGQTFAIAGLLEDTMKNTKAGNVPYLEWLFGTRDSTRNENELVILVTPELVHPMEPEEVPPLPGFDVTEPTNKEFYWHGHLEGHPTSGYRSTVWPELRRRYRAGGPTMTSGPFGHGQ